MQHRQWNFIYSKHFLKMAYKIGQNKPNLARKIHACTSEFEKSLFSANCYRKKLKGTSDLHELEVSGDIRIIVHIQILGETICFVDIGTHSQLGFGEK